MGVAGDDAVRPALYGRDEDVVVLCVLCDDSQVQLVWGEPGAQAQLPQEPLHL